MPGASKIHSFLLVSIHRRELHYCIQEALRRVDRQHKELKLTNPSPLAKWHLRHPRLHTANVRLQGRTTLFAPDHLPLRSCPRQIALPCFINFDSSAVHMFAMKNMSLHVDMDLFRPISCFQNAFPRFNGFDSSAPHMFAIQSRSLHIDTHQNP